MLEAAWLEKSLMDQLGSHGNILGCDGYFEDGEYMLLIFELMERDMRDIMNEMNAPLQEIHAKNIVYQLLQALEHCHAQSIIHRDVKLENLLIKRVEEE